MNTEQIIGQYFNKDGTLMSRELNHRFSGTHCAIKDDRTGKWIPKKISQFNVANRGREKRDLYVNLNNFSGTDLFASSINVMERIRLETPNMGLTNWKGSVLYVKIQANRNWRRGFDIGSLTFKDPLISDSNLLGVYPNMGREQSKVEVITSLYNNEYATVEEGMKKIVDLSVRAVHISPSFFLCITNTSEDIIIGYKKWLVGRVEMDLDGGYTPNLFESNEHLIEELSQLFNGGQNE